MLKDWVGLTWFGLCVYCLASHWLREGGYGSGSCTATTRSGVLKFEPLQKYQKKWYNSINCMILSVNTFSHRKLFSVKHFKNILKGLLTKWCMSQTLRIHSPTTASHTSTEGMDTQRVNNISSSIQKLPEYSNSHRHPPSGLASYMLTHEPQGRLQPL